MRAALVCLLLTLFSIIGTSGRASAKKKNNKRRSIWGSIRRNGAGIKKLTRAIKETTQFEEEFGPVIETLKENVDDMKEGFASQTMLIAQMKMSIDDMKDSVKNLENITFEECWDKKSDPLGENYGGFVSTTVSGITCQAWASKHPHKPGAGIKGVSELPENHCRNPDKHGGGPWCYTTDKKKKWEICPVPICTTGDANGKGEAGDDYSISQGRSNVVLRGPVDQTKVLRWFESCSGEEDGTRCTKRCKHWTCKDSARCWQGQCKRFPYHPCDTTGEHSCCCGNCYKPMDDLENDACFAAFLN